MWTSSDLPTSNSAESVSFRSELFSVSLTMSAVSMLLSYSSSITARVTSAARVRPAMRTSNAGAKKEVSMASARAPGLLRRNDETRSRPEHSRVVDAIGDRDFAPRRRIAHDHFRHLADGVALRNVVQGRGADEEPAPDFHVDALVLLERDVQRGAHRPAILREHREALAR